MELLKCLNLTMSYEDVVAIKNLSFSVEQGDYLCVIGENGCGKSTLVKGILGLKQASEGEIRYVSVKQKEIGYLPQQNALQKDFPATVREVVLSGCLNENGLRPFYTKAQKHKANEMIKKLSLGGLAKKSFRDLSGGQQQRVLIARALCATDKLLLLDEPVTGLDPLVTSELYNLIYHLNKVHGITIIMVTHDVANALSYANKVLHIVPNSCYFGSADDYKKTCAYQELTGGKSNA